MEKRLMMKKEKQDSAFSQLMNYAGSYKMLLSGAECRQRPRHPSQPPRKERPRQPHRDGRRRPAEV